MIESTVWSYLLYISHSVMHRGCKIRWKSYIFDLSKKKVLNSAKRGRGTKSCPVYTYLVPVFLPRTCVFTSYLCFYPQDLFLLTWSYQEYSRTTFRTAHLTLDNNQSINESIKIGTRKLKIILKCIMCFLLQKILKQSEKMKKTRKRKKRKSNWIIFIIVHCIYKKQIII